MSKFSLSNLIHLSIHLNTHASSLVGLNAIPYDQLKEKIIQKKNHFNSII